MDIKPTNEPIQPKLSIYVVKMMSTAHEDCDIVNFPSNCSGNDESLLFPSTSSLI